MDEDRSMIEPAAQSFEAPRGNHNFKDSVIIYSFNNQNIQFIVEHIDDPKPQSMSGLKLFLLMLFGVLGVFVCVVMGIIFYQKQQEQSRKRFY